MGQRPATLRLLPVSRRQRGAALLIFMLIFFLAATSWILGHGSAGDARNQLDEATSKAMAQAREALIGRTASDDNRPGSLPCPDLNNNGEAELLVGNNCPAYVGRLPWKTLGLPQLVDGRGDRLWYALSPSLRDDDSAEPINPMTSLELSFDGTPNIAAVIFSAGIPLANQTGRPSNAVSDYLDDGNNDGNSSYTSGPPSLSFNDRTLVITRNDVFSAVNRRILAELRGNATTGLGKYYIANANNYPSLPADLQTELSPNTLLVKNAWYPLVTYNVDASRQEAVLTIALPTAVSCTITPSQMLCPHP